MTAKRKDTRPPANPWGDAAFHLRNAARALRGARDEAMTETEHDLAERMRVAVEGAHRVALDRARGADLAHLVAREATE